MRLALLSFWHVHAADYAREAAEHPETEIVAVWDERPERGRLEAETRGLAFVDNLDAVLADPVVDGVIVTTPTTAHGEIIPAAARAGKHVFAEKVIAPTLAESLAIVDAVESAGVTLTIALTRAVEPATTRALDLIAAGEIGTVTGARVRIAHDGALPTPDRPGGWLPERFFDPAESGGGALIDLGAHPLYLARLFLGMPESLVAALGDVTGRGVDDNAAVLLRTASGAIGVAETSFVDRGGGFGWSVSGTEGALSYTQGDGVLTLRRDRREASTTIELPPEAPRPFARWVDAVRDGASTRDNVALALDLSALAEAAGRSASSGGVARLDELTGWGQLTGRSASAT